MSRKVIIVGCLLWAGWSWAVGVPQLVNYQGRLTNAAGQMVGDGTQSMAFTIYDSSSGGSSLWMETQPVSVRQGTFNVLLGSSVPLPATIFDATSRWLGVKVNSDPEMSPRSQVGSNAYAVLANNVAEPRVDVISEKTSDAGVTVDGLLIKNGTLPNYPSSSLFSQALINGNFDVWQRNTTFTNIADLACSADRWKSIYNNGSTTAISRGNTTPPDGSNYYLEVNHTASDDSGIRQVIEDGWAFKNRKVTVSLKLRKKTAAFNRNILVTLKYGDVNFGVASQTVINTYTVNAASLSANSWYPAAGTFTVPSNSSVVTLAVDIMPASTGTDGFQVAQVQLCAGEVALPFQPQSFESELHACQRYFETNIPYGNPVANFQPPAWQENFVCIARTSTEFDCPVYFRVPKRVRPVMTAYSPSDAATPGVGRYSEGAGWTDLSTSTFQTASCGSIYSDFFTGTKSGANFTSQTAYFVRVGWSADAEY